VFNNPLIKDIEDLIGRGWVWFTVIPAKSEEKKEEKKEGGE